VSAVEDLVTDRHSRSRLAGYDPMLLAKAAVLVVGAGALGQNLAQNLALAGVGTIEIADHDTFEDHNRTRSPCYPTAQEQAAWGLGKAEVVARKVRPLMAADRPAVRWAALRVQEGGDALIERADVVCSAVDNAETRHYLSDRCRIHGRPFVEGGFEGPRVNLSVFSADPSQPCFRCLVPSRAGVFSCDRYALAAEAQRIVPAIQNGAATLAAIQAEQAIETLHGRSGLVGRRLFLDIRTFRCRAITLSLDPDCDGIHWPAGEHVETGLDPSATMAQLATAVLAGLGECELILPEQFVVRIPCTGCHALTEAMTPAWRWEVDPRCERCGGPFPPSPAGGGPFGYSRLLVHHLDEWDAIGGLTLRHLGLGDQAAIEAEILTDGRRAVVRLTGAASVNTAEEPVIPG